MITKVVRITFSNRHLQKHEQIYPVIRFFNKNNRMEREENNL